MLRRRLKKFVCLFCIFAHYGIQGIVSAPKARLCKGLKMQRQLGLSKHSPAYHRIFYPCPSVSSVVQNLSHHARSAAGRSARRMSDVFSQSRASSLVEGFENATPAWLVQAQPCVPLPSALSVSIRVISGSKFIAPRASTPAWHV